MTHALLILALLFGLAAPAPAADAPARAELPPFIPPRPKDYAKVEVYLLTVGRGAQIHSLFGHTFLRVVDTDINLDMNFNWGIFDYADPLFLWKFYVGDLTYRMEVSDFAGLVNHYRNVEKRRVSQEHVNLTTKQKEKLYDRLIWNAQPENVKYEYSQVYNNCATKPRDYLDEAVGGGIKRFYASRFGRDGFRTFIRDGAKQFFWADVGLDMILNSHYDRVVTQWEEMFLPARLRQHLSEIPAFDDAGLPIRDRNLLEASEVIIDLPEPPAATDPYFKLALVFLLPLGLVSGAAFGRYPTRRVTRSVGLITVVYGLWSSVWGMALVFNWLVSRYPEVKHNAHLFAMWPIDWIFVAFGAKLLFSGTWPASSTFLSRACGLLSRLHVAGILLLVALAAVGIVQQNVTPVIASTGAAGLMLYMLLARRIAAREG